MYSVTVRDHFMIAHRCRGEVFGPAQALHGATYVVDLEFRRPDLDASGIVVDIGRAAAALRAVLAALNYRNLDDDRAFTGNNTPRVYLGGVHYSRLESKLGAGTVGPGFVGVERFMVTRR
jgi:6-pyruvoyl-tetrahydropterin synthase